MKDVKDSAFHGTQAILWGTIGLSHVFMPLWSAEPMPTFPAVLGVAIAGLSGTLAAINGLAWAALKDHGR